MPSPKISVIVPVYNAEKWLRRCVDSILVQIFTDFELLLIDDGSTDGSGAICDEYAMLDSRVRVFHKPNGGVSSARNFGLDNAKGEWISFVDSDDSIYTESLEILLKNSNSDFVVGLIHHINDKLNLPRAIKYNFPKLVFDLADKNKKNFFRLEEELIRVNIFNPLAKLYRTNIIQSECIRFNNQLYFGEDSDFVIRYMTKCQKICVINVEVYEYIEYSTLFFQKYKMNACQYITHAEAIQVSCQNLENVTGHRFSKIKDTILANFGYVYLAGIFRESNYFEFMARHMDYCKSNINPYLDSMKKKLIWEIFKKCPKLAYILFRLVRNRF